MRLLMRRYFREYPGCFIHPSLAGISGLTAICSKIFPPTEKDLASGIESATETDTAPKDDVASQDDVALKNDDP